MMPTVRRLRWREAPEPSGRRRSAMARLRPDETSGRHSRHAGPGGRGGIAVWRFLTAVVLCPIFAASAAVAQTQRSPIAAQVAGSPTGVSAGDGVRVIVRSYETASIGAEINARIIRLPSREGDRFRAGDVLVAFDCRKIVAEHEAAVATMKAHKAVYDNQKQLERYRAAGSLAVEQSLHEMEKAEADARGLEARLSGCVIRAPFDGRVTEKTAQLHEIAQPNQPLIKIINERKLELVLMVPSSWLVEIAEGTEFPVKIDESGETHRARIVQSTGQIDPISQSARLIAELLESPPNVIPGMSGTAKFFRDKERH